MGVLEARTDLLPREKHYWDLGISLFADLNGSYTEVLDVVLRFSPGKQINEEFDIALDRETPHES